MDWAGVAKIVGILAILALLFWAVSKVMKAFKAKWQEEARTEESKAVINATKDLASNLDKPSDSHFRVSKPNSWKKPTTKT